MDKKKRERSKTILLILIMFFGINYAIYTFLIVPKKLELENVKSSYAQVDANKSILDMMIQEKEQLTQQITDTNIITPIYHDLIMEELDTIAMTVDFYNYMKDYNVDGQFVSYTITDIQKGLEEVTVNNVEVDLNDPNYDPTLAVEEIVPEKEDVPYRTAIIDLEVKMDKERLKLFLENLNTLSDQNTFVNSILITAESEATDNGQLTDNTNIVSDAVSQEIVEITSTDNANSTNTELAETTDIAVTDSETAITYETTETSDSNMDIGEIETKDFLVVTIKLESYVVDGGQVYVNKLGYSFYNETEGYPNLSELFDTPTF